MKRLAASFATAFYAFMDDHDAEIFWLWIVIALAGITFYLYEVIYGAHGI